MFTVRSASAEALRAQAAAVAAAEAEAEQQLSAFEHAAGAERGRLENALADASKENFHEGGRGGRARQWRDGWGGGAVG